MKLSKKMITRIIEGIAILIIMAVLMIVYNRILNLKEEKTDEEVAQQKEKIIFENIDKEKFSYIDEYTIYGNHLNISGHINSEEIVNDAGYDLKLVVMDLDKNETEYDLNYEIIDEKIQFNLSENINEGINLENIDEGEYYVFVKLYRDEQNIKYFSLVNESEYEGNEYYTLTKESTNRKIDISFSSLDSIDYMKITSKTVSLPSNVYDIVIDAGHGGKDPGAMYEDYTEAEYTLDYANELKRKLEELGYKVKLTREKDEYVESYGKNGRAIVPYETKSKLFISLHLNSTAADNPEGGVEVYCSNSMNLDFAKSFADNIVTIANTIYSPNNQYKVLDGVYIRNYSEDEIKEAIEYANDLEYEPYESLSTKTPYYFMIRETGGIMTHAYIDGRNTNIGENPYYDSNIAAESYLLELGFINSQSDLENLQKNQDSYIYAIVKTIVDNYNK